MIKTLVEGNAMTTEIPEIDLVLTLVCKPEVTKDFREAVAAAMLHMLPAAPGTH